MRSGPRLASTLARGPLESVPVTVYTLDTLMSEARRLAAEYRRTTGKTLPVSGELAVHDAIRLLDLRAAPAGAAGYDAVRVRDGRSEQLLVKGRVVFDDSRGGQRIGQLRVDQPWDAVLVVLLDAAYEPVEIHEAGRAAVLAALESGGASRRASRGLLSVARFRHIGRRVWSSELGREDDEVWSNRTDG